MLDMKVLIMLGDILLIQIIIIIIICLEIHQDMVVMVVATADMVATDMVIRNRVMRKTAGTVGWMIKKKKVTIQLEMKSKKIPEILEEINLTG